MQEILSDEIDDPEFLEFAVEDFSEMMGYIAMGNLKHQNSEGYYWRDVVWGVADKKRIVL